MEYRLNFVRFSQFRQFCLPKLHFHCLWSCGPRMLSRLLYFVQVATFIYIVCNSQELNLGSQFSCSPWALKNFTESLFDQCGTPALGQNSASTRPALGQCVISVLGQICYIGVGPTYGGSIRPVLGQHMWEALGHCWPNSMPTSWMLAVSKTYIV